MRPLLLNLICVAERFEEFRDLDLTFHLGDDPLRRNPAFDPARAYNREQLTAAITRLEQQFGSLEEHPIAGRFVPKQPPKGGAARSWIRRCLKAGVRS